MKYMVKLKCPGELDNLLICIIVIQLNYCLAVHWRTYDNYNM